MHGGINHGNTAVPAGTASFEAIAAASTQSSDAIIDGDDLCAPIYGETYMESNFAWIFNDSPEMSFPSATSSADFISATDAEQTSVNNSLEADTVVLSQVRANSPDSCILDRIPSSTQRLVLPQLGEFEDELPPTSNFTATVLHPSTRIKLIDAIHTPLERGPWQPALIENFPSCPKLEHCIDMYFMHFNTVRHHS